MRTSTIRQNASDAPDMDKIRKVAGKPDLNEGDVFNFPVFVIARSGINRNHSDITGEAQKAAVKEWVGKAILYRDHESSSSNQIGRIYDAWTEDRPGETVTLGKGYGIRTHDLESIFKRIEGGIHREMSCGYEPTKSVCSNCNADLAGPSRMDCPNGHVMGRDAHARDLAFQPDHISFVARPAVEGAGVVHVTGEAIRLYMETGKGDLPNDLTETLSGLRRAADDGRIFREWVTAQFIKWHRMVLDDPWPVQEIEELASKLTAKEMIRLGRIERDRFSEVIPTGQQLSQASIHDHAQDDAPCSPEYQSIHDLFKRKDNKKWDK